MKTPYMILKFCDLTSEQVDALIASCRTPTNMSRGKFYGLYSDGQWRLQEIPFVQVYRSGGNPDTNKEMVEVRVDFQKTGLVSEQQYLDATALHKKEGGEFDPRINRIWGNTNLIVPIARIVEELIEAVGTEYLHDATRDIPFEVKA